jgi:hypothetical protein
MGLIAQQTAAHNQKTLQSFILESLTLSLLVMLSNHSVNHA